MDIGICEKCFNEVYEDTMHHFIDRDHEECCQNNFCSKQCLINYLLGKITEDDFTQNLHFTNNSSNSCLNSDYNQICDYCRNNTNGRSMYYFIENGHELCCHKGFCSLQCNINYLISHMNKQISHNMIDDLEDAFATNFTL